MNDNFKTIDNTVTIHDIFPINSKLLSVGKSLSSCQNLWTFWEKFISASAQKTIR